MSDVTLIDLVGRMLMVGFEGEEMTSDVRELLLTVRPAGIILFQRNLGRGPEQAARLVGACQDLARSVFGRPLLAAIDQEGGPVRRLGPPFSVLPSQREMAENLGPDEVRALGSTSGRELAAVGINFNLAPVLDLTTEPEAMYMAERSFGSDPELAASLGLALIDGHAKHGVLTCAKHFPGIGDVGLDPHQDLPTVAHPAARLKELEVTPFARAIARGVPAVMTSHVNFPGLDPDGPATFSTRIQTDLLRTELGFKGLVLTDDLEMGAILRNYPVGLSAVRAVLAGADLVLVCRRADLIMEARQALIEAMRQAEITTGRLEETSARLETVWAGLRPPGPEDLPEVFGAGG